jgi:hypothetical protein
MTPDLLPLIAVRVVNETDTTLSVSFPSAACTPRVILAPRESAIIRECIRHGLVYQGVAVFYDRDAVQGRRFRLLVAVPGADWVFGP